MEQRRHFSRVLFAATAHLVTAQGRFPCDVLDLSLKGALVRLHQPKNWPIGETIALELSLDTGHHSNIRMHTQLAHHENEVFGLRCVDIDLDSMTHLRRLIELNSEDDNPLQRELSALRAD